MLAGFGKWHVLQDFFLWEDSEQAILKVPKTLQSVEVNQTRNRPRNMSIVTSIETRAWPGCPKERTNSSGGQQRGPKEGTVPLSSSRVNSMSSTALFPERLLGTWCHYSALGNNEFV